MGEWFTSVMWRGFKEWVERTFKPDGWNCHLKLQVHDFGENERGARRSSGTCEDCGRVYHVGI